MLLSLRYVNYWLLKDLTELIIPGSKRDQATLIPLTRFKRWSSNSNTVQPVQHLIDPPVMVNRGVIFGANSSSRNYISCHFYIFKQERSR